MSRSSTSIESLLENLLTEHLPVDYIETLYYNSFGGRGDTLMLKSPCLSCDRSSEDKNQCLEDCKKLQEYQEMLLKQGIYATM